jgi:hypothetical protein
MSAPQYNPYARQYVPPQYRLAPEPRNGLGTAAMILGIIALALSWIPFVGFVGFICGLVGVGLGIGGLVRINKRRATNRTSAIIGTLLSVIAVIISIAVFVLAANALDDAFGARDVTSAGAPGDVAGPPKTTFNVGETADVEGLRVTLSNGRQVRDNGQNYLCADVAYDNQSGEQRPFNSLSWEVKGGDNVIAMSTLRFGGIDESLKSGALDTGGKVAGEVCWNTPAPGEIKMIWTESLGSSTKATWVARL